MTKLCQVLAIEKGAKSKREAVMTEAYHAAQKPDLFRGISRTYRPLQEDGETLPSEETRVTRTANGLISAVESALIDLFDITFAKDKTNTGALADVMVDGTVLLPQVPVTYLLFLEKQLIDLRTFVSKLPTLDPAETWTWSEAANCWESAPSGTARTKKVFVPIIMTPATDKHPAQIEKTTEDQRVGTWTTKKFSGALPASRVSELLQRVEKLQRAVKFAREESNLLPATEERVGEKIFHFLFGLGRRGRASASASAAAWQRPHREGSNPSPATPAPRGDASFGRVAQRQRQRASPQSQPLAPSSKARAPWSYLPPSHPPRNVGSTPAGASGATAPAVPQASWSNGKTRERRSP